MPGRSHRQSGFSFIEVLIGVVILTIVAGGVLMGFSASSAQTARAKLDTVSSKLAAGRLESIRTMDYGDVGIPGGNPEGSLSAKTVTTVDGLKYTVATAVTYVDDQTPGRARNYINYKKVSVTVTPELRVGQPVTQSTLMAPPNAGAIRGKSTAIIGVQDTFTNAVLPGITAKLYGSTSPPRQDVTGADGRVIFAGLDPSDPVVGSAKHYYMAAAEAAGYETDPDSTPTQVRQSLAASQTWNATIKVFRPLTIVVRAKDVTTGEPITKRTQVKVTLPSPQGSQTFVGYTGQWTIPKILGQSIIPSATGTQVDVDADCYAPKKLDPAVISGYPANTTQLFEVSMVPLANTGNLRVWVKNTGGSALSNAQVQVSGGEAAVNVPLRQVDSNGYVDFCLPKSTASLYTVSVVASGYRSTSIVSAVPSDATVDQTVVMSTSPRCTLGIKHRLGGSQRIRITGLGSTAGTDLELNTSTFTGIATFTSLTPGTYYVRIVNGYSGSTPNWISAGTSPGVIDGNVNCPSLPDPVNVG